MKVTERKGWGSKGKTRKGEGEAGYEGKRREQGTKGQSRAGQGSNINKSSLCHAGQDVCVCVW